MNIIFSDHAIFQIRERKISEESILAVLNNPDKIILQTNLRKQAIKLSKRKRNKKNYLLIVVYEEKGGTKKIITAFITSKVKKYL